VPIETTLEMELRDVLAGARLCRTRTAAVAQRLGLDGNGPSTLQAAGDRHGYSRERVRQLEVIARRHVMRARPALPVLSAAVALLESAAPDDRSFLGALLGEQLVAGRPFDPAGVLAAAELAGIATPLTLHGRFVTLGDKRPDRTLVRAARLLASDRSEITISLLGGLYGYDNERVRRLLEGHRDVRWTSEAHSALCVATPSLERRIAGVLKKLLAMSPRVPVAELDDALRSGVRPVALPQRVLGNICASFAWAQLDKDHEAVRALVHLDRRQVLSQIEFKLARIFLTFGPVLSFRDALRIGSEEGLNPSSIGVYLTRTPILSRLERGRYALRGATV
jgi:NAD(P)H-dependent FMN reductase